MNTTSTHSESLAVPEFRYVHTGFSNFYWLTWCVPGMQAAFLFTVVGTTGFLGLIAGQLPGVNHFAISFVFPCYEYGQSFSPQFFIIYFLYSLVLDGKWSNLNY